MSKIRAVLKQDGTVELDAIGFEGHDCSAALKPYQDALSGKQTEKLKPEYYKKKNKVKVTRDV